MNIVVRSPNWIGDCIMSLPALRALRKIFPQASISLVTRENLLDIFININEIDQVISIPERNHFFLTVKKIREFFFDFGILFTNSFHSALLFRLSGIKKLIGYKKDLRGLLLYKKEKFPSNDKHHTTFYQDLVEEFSRTRPDAEKTVGETFSDELLISEDEKKQVGFLLQKKEIKYNRPLIGISPSAAYGSAKEWIPERFVELISKLGNTRPDLQFLIFGSGKERVGISKISETLGKNVFNLAGELTLRESIVAISLCSLFISNDSGLMHIASSVRIPTIAIFGPTLPHKTAPSNKMVRVLYHPVDCAPCKDRECPLDHRCMKEIEVDEVFEEAMGILSR